MEPLQSPPTQTGNKRSALALGPRQHGISAAPHYMQTVAGSGPSVTTGRRPLKLHTVGTQ